MPKAIIPVVLSDEDCAARGLPPMIHWRMRSGVVLHSCFTPTTVEVAKTKYRCFLRRFIPRGAVAWSLADGVERPLGELPPAWRLRGVEIAGHRHVDDDEEADDD